MTRKKLSKFKVRIDEYLFFYNNVSNFSGKSWFCGKWEYSAEGLAPLSALYIFESEGVRKSCNDLETLNLYFKAMAATDLQIKQWALGIAETLFTKSEYIEYKKEKLFAKWILKATFNQADKLYWSNEKYQKDRESFHKTIVKNKK